MPPIELGAERNLQAHALQCLRSCDADVKCALTARIGEAWRTGDLTLDSAPSVEEIESPGRPLKPDLVPPGKVARRGYSNRGERAALLHALAHIEFNAVNLGWDAVYRFRGLPKAYYDDWVQVAEDEARHFLLLRDRLRDHGHEYGDFSAHNGLWEMAMKTSGDLVARMALVPRVLEARSLDVVPGIVRKLRGVGDRASAEVLELIEREEVAHVAAGSRWFRFVCEREGREPTATFRALIEQYMKGRVKGPFHFEARRAAGFDDDEITLLEELGG
ncbi:MAG: ferritin-like domain-containing protein [Gammaproteobacteria bacterium]|nr:ferritin-like domain-containing protein [Gammaproteobacteria bacterium]MCP5136997.1 ferritin-like domain-containing protein [Gammaproteobacteria bacterium]